MEPRFKIKSIDGSLLNVYEDHISITQEGVRGLITRGLAGEKSFFYSDLSSIQFKNCGWTAGFIEFTFPGSIDRHGTAMSNTKNENRFNFGRPTIGGAKKLAKEMEVVKDFIESKILESRNQSQQVINYQKSDADELLKFKQLLDSGIITQEEFEIKKRQLLGL